MNEGLALAALPGEGVRGLRYERSPFGLRGEDTNPMAALSVEWESKLTPTHLTKEGRGENRQSYPT